MLSPPQNRDRKYFCAHFGPDQSSRLDVTKPGTRTTGWCGPKPAAAAAAPGEAATEPRAGPVRSASETPSRTASHAETPPPKSSV